MSKNGSRSGNRGNEGKTGTRPGLPHLNREISQGSTYYRPSWSPYLPSAAPLPADVTDINITNTILLAFTNVVPSCIFWRCLVRSWCTSRHVRRWCNIPITSHLHDQNLSAMNLPAQALFERPRNLQLTANPILHRAPAPYLATKSLKVNTEQHLQTGNLQLNGYLDRNCEVVDCRLGDKKDKKKRKEKEKDRTRVGSGPNLTPAASLIEEYKLKEIERDRHKSIKSGSISNRWLAKLAKDRRSESLKRGDSTDSIPKEELLRRGEGGGGRISDGDIFELGERETQPSTPLHGEFGGWAFGRENGVDWSSSFDPLLKEEKKKEGLTQSLGRKVSVTRWRRGSASGPTSEEGHGSASGHTSERGSRKHTDADRLKKTRNEKPRHALPPKGGKGIWHLVRRLSVSTQDKSLMPPPPVPSLPSGIPPPVPPKKSRSRSRKAATRSTSPISSSDYASSSYRLHQEPLPPLSSQFVPSPPPKPTTDNNWSANFTRSSDPEIASLTLPPRRTPTKPTAKSPNVVLANTPRPFSMSMTLERTPLQEFNSESIRSGASGSPIIPTFSTEEPVNVFPKCLSGKLSYKLKASPTTPGSMMTGTNTSTSSPMDVNGNLFQFHSSSTRQHFYFLRVLSQNRLHLVQHATPNYLYLTYQSTSWSSALTLRSVRQQVSSRGILESQTLPSISIAKALVGWVLETGFAVVVAGLSITLAKDQVHTEAKGLIIQVPYRNHLWKDTPLPNYHPFLLLLLPAAELISPLQLLPTPFPVSPHNPSSIVQERPTHSGPALSPSKGITTASC
ncbi:hypothetical protein CPB83DRAFT_920449 [Crepidotus variabilis]|uniref:Uncharacterized protein n=1 Tax=Crepidotus variabilis TaxID=179855 RepID=A0A9P6E3P1_9AGAR|nr:hypothetical protein CPB83DRAFT_920449 [Crepidotus variabilis]